VTPRTLFNVFSVSKALLSMGVHKLLDEGRIELDASIAEYWPAFGAAGKSAITVRHALAHQAGLANAMPPASTLDRLCDWDNMTAFIASAQPEHAPGHETHYHYLSFAWICGGLIEAVTGEPYEAYLASRVLELLGIAGEVHMGGLPPHIPAQTLATLSLDRRSARRGDARGSGNEHASDPDRQQTERAQQAANAAGGDAGAAEESDRAAARSRLNKFKGQEQLMNPSVFNMRKVRAAKLPSANGHATAVGLATALDSIRDGSGLFSSRTLARMREEQRPPGCTDVLDSSPPAASSALLENAQAAYGLGFQVHEMRLLSDGSSYRSLGHSGLGGSIALTVPELRLSVAFTTNLLGKRNEAKRQILAAVCDEYGLVAPPSLLE